MELVAAGLGCRRPLHNPVGTSTVQQDTSLSTHNNWRSHFGRIDLRSRTFKPLICVCVHSLVQVIFSGHRPLYDSTTYGFHSVVVSNMRTAIEPLLVKYRVNLALWGHVHVYERTCGMNNFVSAQDDSDAPVHVIIGMAGHNYQVRDSFGEVARIQMIQPATLRWAWEFLNDLCLLMAGWDGMG